MSHSPPPSKTWLWIGRILSALPVLLLTFSAFTKLSRSPMVVKGFSDFGYSSAVLVPIGFVELISTLLYAIPQTAILGAVLLTGYLGGATATHVRVGDLFAGPVVIGVIVWLGLLAREPRLRALLPFRRSTTQN